MNQPVELERAMQAARELYFEFTQADFLEQELRRKHDAAMADVTRLVDKKAKAEELVRRLAVEACYQEVFE
jgi:hypothetical protein